EAVHRSRRAAASPSQHTGDKPGIVLRPQMIFGIIKRLAVLISHNDRVVHDDIKAFGNAARIRPPWCSGLYDDLFHFVGHMMPSRGYSISRRHLSCAAFPGGPLFVFINSIFNSCYCLLFPWLPYNTVSEIGKNSKTKWKSASFVTVL